jgi:hypothetical protein
MKNSPYEYPNRFFCSSVRFADLRDDMSKVRVFGQLALNSFLKIFEAIIFETATPYSVANELALQMVIAGKVNGICV